MPLVLAKQFHDMLLAATAIDLDQDDLPCVERQSSVKPGTIFTGPRPLAAARIF
jgi:hypothetical protein